MLVPNISLSSASSAVRFQEFHKRIDNICKIAIVFFMISPLLRHGTEERLSLN